MCLTAGVPFWRLVGWVEHKETVRIWRAGERVRVEHHGGERDGYYAVAEELQIMLNPVPLLSSLRRYRDEDPTRTMGSGTGRTRT